MTLKEPITEQETNQLSREVGHSGLMDEAIALIQNPRTGGLPGLVKCFRDRGLGDIIDSWISTRPNLPISPEQVRSVFGEQQIQIVATKLGMDEQTAASGLADVLPTVIDRLTPDGMLPEGSMIDKGLAMIKGLMGKS